MQARSATWTRDTIRRVSRMRTYLRDDSLKVSIIEAVVQVQVTVTALLPTLVRLAAAALRETITLVLHQLPICMRLLHDRLPLPGFHQGCHLYQSLVSSFHFESGQDVVRLASAHCAVSSYAQINRLYKNGQKQWNST